MLGLRTSFSRRIRRRSLAVVISHSRAILSTCIAEVLLWFALQRFLEILLAGLSIRFTFPLRGHVFAACFVDIAPYFKVEIAL